MKSSHPERYAHAVDLFNAGEYFETHEELEDLWNATTGDEHLYYQAILQAAVALHHFRNGNRTGALSLLRNYREKIDRLPFDRFMGLNLPAFVEQMEAYFRPLVESAEQDEVRMNGSLVPKIPVPRK